MIHHYQISESDLRKTIKNKLVLFGGNLHAKIYGRLNCTSGKRLKKQNRVFFASEKDAVDCGFRPCGHCMRTAYKKWRDEIG